ncbi:flagellar basal body P-ring formation chaperone FlgA [Niveibacterium sp. 24ML]|uniref:flagellar basal body P-ring formation chaperone FlgA n=1 Tax=Niveibacterium sp. 24ML TaxID=2985512 RepID=UPI00226E0E1C|nr:flagellar basal body P-ring formation chaperone FlgA [Niveibacterium sp. 24ML]MCX9157960.1 flagellar basal body P-ring formation chaperone FlgA [Niveibacterium sp. 24ML]
MRPSLRRYLTALPCATLLAALTPGASQAAMSEAQAAIHSAVTTYLAREAAAFPGRVSVQIGENAIPRNAKPCPALQLGLPAGQRAWGKTTVGVRCAAPSWAMYVPARVVIEGSYLVAARPLAAGARLESADWEIRTGDIASQPPGVLTDPSQALGRTLRQPVSGGLALRSNQLLVVQAVERGQRVRVTSSGGGFEVANEGVALAAAAEGQVVQVRLDSGRVLQGVARAGGRVEVGQ